MSERRFLHISIYYKCIVVHKQLSNNISFRSFSSYNDLKLIRGKVASR